MLRHCNHGIGAACNQPAGCLQQFSLAKMAAVRADYTKHVTAAHGYHQRQPLGKCEHSTLPELCVHQVIVRCGKSPLNAEPGGCIVPEPAFSSKVEDININARSLQELRLTLYEVRRYGNSRLRPLAGNHQYTEWLPRIVSRWHEIHPGPRQWQQQCPNCRTIPQSHLRRPRLPPLPA